MATARRSGTNEVISTYGDQTTYPTRDYDEGELGTWETAEQADLTSTLESPVLEVYSDLPEYVDGGMFIDGWTTNSTYFPIIRPNDISNKPRFYVTAQRGIRTNVLSSVQDLIFKTVINSSLECDCVRLEGSADGSIIVGCETSGVNSGTGTSGGITLVQYANDSKIINNFCDSQNYGITSGRSSEVYNNTVINCAIGFYNDSTADASVLKNNLALGCTIPYEANGIAWGTGSNYNATDLGGVVDSETVTSTGTQAVGDSSSTKYVSAQFTASETCTLRKLDLYLQKVGSPTFNITASIYSDDGAGEPNTLVGTASGSVAVSGIGTSEEAVEFTGGLNAPITASSVYHIVITVDTVGDGSNYIQWHLGTDQTPTYYASTSSDASTWADGSTKVPKFVAYTGGATGGANDIEECPARDYVLEYPAIDFSFPESSSNSFNLPTIKPEVQNSMVVVLASTDDTATCTWTSPSGMTEREQAEEATEYVSILICDELQTSLAEVSKVVTTNNVCYPSLGIIALTPQDNKIPFYRNSASGTFSNTTDIVVTKPVNTSEGDLMIVSVGGNAGFTVTPPTGWTELVNTINYTSDRFVIFYKFAGASEGVNYTFTGSYSGYGSWCSASYANVARLGTTTQHRLRRDVGYKPLGISGADLSSDSNFAFDDDILGNTIVDQYHIGCHWADVPSARRKGANENINTYGDQTTYPARDYDDGEMGTWESAVDGDIVASKQSEVLEIYDDQPYYTDACSFTSGDTWVTNRWYNVIIRPNDVTRRKPVVELSSRFGFYGPSQEYTYVQDIGIRGTFNTGDSCVAVWLYAYSLGVGLEVDYIVNSGAGSVSGLKGNALFFNCIVDDIDGIGITVPTVSFSSNNVVTNCATGISWISGSPATITNNIALGCTTPFYTGSIWGSGTDCNATDGGTATGGTNDRTGIPDVLNHLFEYEGSRIYSTSETNNPTTPVIRTPVDNCMLVGIVSGDSVASNTFTPPSGFTEREDLQYAVSVSSSTLADFIKIYAGEFQPQTFVANRTNEWATSLVCLVPTVGNTPSFRDSDSGTIAADSTPTVNKPATTAEGDLMVVAIHANNTVVTLSSMPTGWNLLFTQATGGTYTGIQWVFWKFAGASEPSTWDWTFSGSINGTWMSASYDNVYAVAKENYNTRRDVGYKPLGISGSSLPRTSTVFPFADDINHNYLENGKLWNIGANYPGVPSARRKGANENISTYGDQVTYPTRDYDEGELATWENATDNDLVTAEQSEVLECYADQSSFSEATLNFVTSVATTSEWYNRCVRPAKGHEHKGTIDQGFIFNLYSTYIAVYADEPYLRIHDLHIIHQGNTASPDRLFYLIDNYLQVVGVLGKQNNSGAGSSICFDNAGTPSAVIVDCVAYDCDEIGFYNRNGNVYNCTAINCGINGHRISYSSGVSPAPFKNCLGHSNATDFNLNGYTANESEYNASSDTTAFGTNSRISQTFTFLNPTNDNYQLKKEDTGALRYGKDLSNDADFPFFDDAIGNPFNVDNEGWDIGAFAHIKPWVKNIAFQTEITEDDILVTNSLPSLPKACLLDSIQYSDSDTYNGDYVRFVVGMSSGIGSEASCGMSSESVAGTSDSNRSNTNARCFYPYTNAAKYQYKTGAFYSSGIVLSWAGSTTPTGNVFVFATILGGTEVEANVLSFSADTGGGTQNIAHGLDNVPTGAIFLTNRITSDVGTSGDAFLCVGFSDGTNNAFTHVSSDTAETTTSTSSKQLTTACLSILTLAGGDQGTATALFGSTNLSLVWSTTPALTSRIHALVFSGIDCLVSNFNQPADDGMQQVALTGINTPIGGVVSSFNRASTTSQIDHAIISLGAFDLSAELTITATDEDNIVLGTTDAGRASSLTALKLYDENTVLKGTAELYGLEAERATFRWTDDADDTARQVIGIFFGIPQIQTSVFSWWERPKIMLFGDR